MIKDEKSLFAGLIFLLSGVWFVYQSITRLTVGEILRMGPGYFPMLCGAAMMIIGVLILATMRGETKIDVKNWPWRAILFIFAGVLLFAFGLRRFGFVPSCFAMLLIVSYAKRDAILREALMTSAILTVLCGVVIIWGLSVPMPVFVWR